LSADRLNLTAFRCARGGVKLVGVKFYTALLVGTGIDVALFALQAPKFTALFAAAGVKFCAEFAPRAYWRALRR